MKYIIFSEFNRNHLLFLSYFIIVIIKEVINDLYGSTQDIIASFVKYYSYSISDILSIIPIIIIAIRSKSIPKDTLDKKQTNPEIKLLYTDTMKMTLKRIKKLIKYEVIISLFDFLGKYSNVIFNIILAKSNYTIKKMELNAISVFNIFSMCILSYLILHSPFYRHHYFSLIINSILILGLGAIDLVNIFGGDGWVIRLIYNIMKILNTIFYCAEDVYAKVLLSFYSISPYNLLLYRGLCVGLFSFLFSITFIFVEIPDEKGENSIVFTRFYKIYEDKLNLLYAILNTLNNFFYNIHIFFIIDKFSPTHYSIANNIDTFGSLLVGIIFGKIEISQFFIKLVLCFALIFISLIYNEIIILNFCGLQRYTKLFLQNEANTDISQTKIKNKTFTESESGNEEILINQEIKNTINIKDILDEEDNESSINTT